MGNKQKPAVEEGPYQRTQYANLIRYTSSGTYYARFRVRGKLIWKSLKTDRVTVAQLRLADLQKEERQKAERGQLISKGKVFFEDALQAYRERGFRPANPRSRKDVRPLKPAALAYYEQRAEALLKSWPALAKTEIKSITERDCVDWADRARQKMGATTFNHTLGLLRHTIEFGIKIGARYDNPAKLIMRESEAPKPPKLPEPDQFKRFLAAIRGNGAGRRGHCADLVQFLAFGGFRKTEAAYITWADCDFTPKDGKITVRGHPETGLKNRRLGEFRLVPMLPEMRELLEKLKQQAPDAAPTDAVMCIQECQKSMDRAAKDIGMARITHHDLRHFFATRCIESGVDIPTVSRWLGHADGGALAMRVYGHLRDHHSAEMANKVRFLKVAGGSAPQEPKVAEAQRAEHASSVQA